MPVYAVTDKSTGTMVMVEASRSETAISALVAARFETTVALTASDALRLAVKGVKYLLAKEGDTQVEDETAEIPGEGTRMSVGVFGAAEAAEEPVVEAEEDAADDIEEDVAEDEDEDEAAPAPTSSDWGTVPFADDNVVEDAAGEEEE